MTCRTLVISSLMMIGWGVYAEEPPVSVGLYEQEIARQYHKEDGLPDNDVQALCLYNASVAIKTADGWAKPAGDEWISMEEETPRWILEPTEGGYRLQPYRERDTEKIQVTHYAPRSEAPTVVATAQGIFIKEEKGLFRKATIADGQGRHWAVSDIRGLAIDTEGQIWFATLAGAGCLTREGWRFYTGAEGLPYNDFTCMAAGLDGSVWFGTTKGAIRYKEGQWHYRQGLRWLPNDHVNDIAVDARGNAWIATENGLGWIGYEPMTLSRKADFYEEEMNKIRRTEYGYVSEGYLKKAGDKSEVRLIDSDNDGLWTSMYGAGECFAYGATKDAKARDRAVKAFKALQFLQKVTQMSAEKPPLGYVARTILPGDGPDPNDGRLERDKETRDSDDPLWKVYENRWPKTLDGKWYWKSDTSSDELDGHYFFYPLYYDLVAATEEERDEVREVVRDLTDHLIANDYHLVDHDGTPTRWGVFGPEALNKDPNWWVERGLNSLSALSYLAVAGHVTGDPKYTLESKRLCEEHGYLNNIMFNKFQFGPGSGNQSDDEMAFMNFYNVMRYSKDEMIKRQVYMSFYSAWILEQPEINPFFDFCFAAFGCAEDSDNAPNPYGLLIWDGWLEDSLSVLCDFPMDRVDWGHSNSHRTDIIRLGKQQTTDPFSRHQGNRGHRSNGKVLPVSERYFSHWNTDPWQLDYPGNGRELGNGTVFLLPYYMGLYHGFIEKDS